MEIKKRQIDLPVIQENRYVKLIQSIMEKRKILVRSTAKKIIDCKTKVLIIVLLIVSTGSCVEDDEFKIPELTIEEPVIDGNVIKPDAVLGMLAQSISREGENSKVTFENTENYVEGYVISDDRAGNYFEELIIQDAAADPKAGLKILIDVNPLFSTYEFGRKIYIKLDGLSVGLVNGVPSLGVLAGNVIDKIPSFLQKEVLLRATEVASIVPKEIMMEDFSDPLLHQYIRINNVQFSKNQVLMDNPFTFAAEPFDQFDGERILESCQTGRRAILSTSTFSDFNGLQLPQQQGSFTGILTKDFFGETFNLVLNDPSGLVFENPDRCDPQVLECEGDSAGTLVVFEEDFTNKTISDLESEGWVNSNVTGGALVYSIGSFGGNQYAEITGFDSGETAYEVWLITPEIDLATTKMEQLSLDIQSGFDNGTILTMYITNNFTGNISQTSWTQLDAIIPIASSNGFGVFEPIGPTNISCLEGKVRIGFKYAGGDPSQTTRYHIDNLKIRGE